MSDSFDEEYDMLCREYESAPTIEQMFEALKTEMSKKFHQFKQQHNELIEPIKKKLDELKIQQARMQDQVAAIAESQDELTNSLAVLKLQINEEHIAQEARTEQLNNLDKSTCAISQQVAELKLNVVEELNARKAREEKLEALDKTMSTIAQQVTELDQTSVDNNTRCQILFDQQNSMHANIRRLSQPWKANH